MLTDGCETETRRAGIPNDGVFESRNVFMSLWQHVICDYTFNLSRQFGTCNEPIFMNTNLGP